MKALVKYNPEILDALVLELDKECGKSRGYIINGVSQNHMLFKKREIHVAGKTIDLTKGLREKVDNMSAQTFSYHIKHKGELVLEFKSMNDRLPSIIRKPAEKMMVAQIKHGLRKEFGKNILDIKQVKEE
jgi:hypothetical protein